MLRNPDPKPGRWILPLVITGMVAFAYFFIQALEAPESSAGPIVTTSSSPTTLPALDTTTTTTLPATIVAYLDAVTAAEEGLSGLSERMQEANRRFDAKETEFGPARSEIEAIITELRSWGDGVLQLLAPGPAGAALPHQDLLDSVEPVVDAADRILAGLLSTDTGAARRTALSDMSAAAEAFISAAGTAKTAAGA